MRNFRYAYLNIMVIGLVISDWAFANSDILGFFQDPARVIHQKLPFNAKDPLEITEIKVKDETVILGKNFTADGEWLKDVTIKLTNTYSKPITYAQINIDFPEIMFNEAMLQYQVLLGRHPDYKDEQRPEARILPGKSVELPLSAEYTEIKRQIELSKRPVESVNKIVIKLSEAAFDDNTLYSGGRLHVRNPDPKGRPKWLQVN